MPDTPTSDDESRHNVPVQPPVVDRGKFFYLLMALLILLVGAAFLEILNVSEVVFCFLLTSVLLVAVVSVCRQHKNLLPGLAIGIPVAVLNWVGYATGSFEVYLAHNIAIIIFFIFVAWHVLAAVINDRRVTLDTIRGAVCVFLLAGLAWAYVYGTILLLDSEAIRIPTGDEETGLSPFGSSNFTEIVYFSFVTITALGYGDIAPASAPARTTAYLQAIFGQFYLAVMVARLVAIHIMVATNQQE